MYGKQLEKQTCIKCGRELDASRNFFSYRDGTKLDMCKRCLTLHLDNFEPETFLWILQKVDVPYVPSEWALVRDQAFAKNPELNGLSVIGKYLSKMKLAQWRHYHWSDTEQIMKKVEEHAAARKEEDDALQQNVKEAYDRGEISEAQYKTYASTVSQHINFEEDLAQARAVMPNLAANTRGVDAPYPQSVLLAELPKVGRKKSQQPPTPPIEREMAENQFDETQFMSEDQLPDLAAELTQEDKIYLAMKWGRLYKPQEWIALEKDYTNMTESFDIQDADTMNAFILMCKTNLKMNQAIDSGDIEGYQKLAKVSDSLRKSTKVTAAQKKEKESQVFDALGQMVAFVEKESGRIPRYDTTVALDKADAAIQNIKNYLKNLIYSDTNLAQQIEDYLKQLKGNAERKKQKAAANEAGLDYIPIEDNDMLVHQNTIEEQIAADQSLMRGDG